MFNTTSYGSGGWGEGQSVFICLPRTLSHCTHMFTVYVSPTGVQVPITSYTCTQPNIANFLDHGQCTVSGGLWTCAIKEGARPALLSSSADLGVYAWDSNTNPFVVLDIPQGWCVGSVEMTFIAPSGIPTLSLSVHNAELLSTNTDRTVFSIVSEEGTRLVVMNLTTLARGKYLRINMTSTGRLYLREIEVFGTSRYTFTDTRNLHDMLTPLLTSLNLSSVTDDSICTHPSSAGGNPASPTTSVNSSTYSVTPISEYTMLVCIMSRLIDCIIPTSILVYRRLLSYFPFAGTSDYSTTSGPSSTPSQSSTIHSSASFTIFTLSASATPALSPRPTTTSAHSSSFTTTPMSSQPSEYTGSCETLLLYCQIHFTSCSNFHQ